MVSSLIPLSAALLHVWAALYATQGENRSRLFRHILDIKHYFKLVWLSTQLFQLLATATFLIKTYPGKKNTKIGK